MPYPEARPRFEEGLDLILQAWQQPEFEFNGRFRKVGRATIWPRPLQKPHPPIWVTALSPDTIVWSARKGYPIASAFLPPSISRQRFELYRKTATEAGHKVGAGHTVQMRNIYVADTDEEARAQAEGPLNHLFRLFIPHAVPKNLDALPEDYQYYKEFFRPFVGAAMTYDDVINNGILVVGSPKTVTCMLAEQVEESGTGHFLCWMNFGSLTPKQVLRSEELFATQVIPELRKRYNGRQEKAA
jgi:alkanesulfonate monooxygenase SsuD/methylene tetrahydromethanopterin reductase-like flavin-dependent oxidoreductase (luciferase family)